MSTAVVIKSLSFLTIVAQAFILAGLVFFSKRKNHILLFIRKNGIGLAFLVSLVATLGSLFFSEVAGFEPCRLCWFQRIFMYPQAIILGLAWFKKDEGITDYILSLSVIGFIIALYHNYIYYSASPAFCGIAKSCTTRYFSEFGYVTIPLMSLTAFLAIILLFLGRKKAENIAGLAK